MVNVLVIAKNDPKDPKNDPKEPKEPKNNPKEPKEPKKDPEDPGEVQKILLKYPTFGGVFDWEYLDAPPDPQDPSQWCKRMKDAKESLWVQGGDIILK